MIGEILSNRYRLVREVGSGGMAKVYLAEDINAGAMVAVKVLYAHFGNDPAYLQRFTREAKLAGALHNKHVVRVLDYGSSRDTYYLVMEYIEGHDLREHLQEHGPLPWAEALRLIDQICLALGEANEYGIVHRDIKPQNVMLTDTGELKVLDFGIARARMLPSLTQSGFIGSPYYISPEQALGEETDIRADIYSTGILLYELLTGHVPFDSQSPWSVINQHIVSTPPQFVWDNGASDIPDRVHTLFERMVAKRPEDRFETPAQVRQAIAAVLAGRSIDSADSDLLPPIADRSALADKLFFKAEAAIENADWQQAVNLLNQVISLNPDHPQAVPKLNMAGQQARLLALYTSAMRALENANWQEAIDQLEEVLAVDPNYKNSGYFLIQAKAGLEKQTRDLSLVAFYDEAANLLAEGQNTAAEKLYLSMKQQWPNSQRLDVLWGEVQRDQQRHPSPPKTPPPAERSRPAWLTTPSLQWLALTTLVVVVIVGVVLGVSRNAALTPTPNPALITRLGELETAVAEEDSARTETLVAEVLALDPENDRALSVQADLAQIEALNEDLAQAFSAITARQWTAALDILESIHQTDPDFQPNTVQTLLCETYLTRGQTRLGQVTGPADQATPQTALSDFRAGLGYCPEQSALQTAADEAGQYVASFNRELNINQLIEGLQDLVTAQPNYANGQAAERLFEAYLSRGDTFYRRDNYQAALADYAAAIALPVANPSPAQRKRVQAQQALTAPPITPTAPLTSSAALTASATLTPTPTATATPGYKYPAPRLSGPEPFANFGGQFTEIVLTWEPVGQLANNEYYDVTIRYFVGEEPRYWGSGLIKETRWRVPVEAGYGVAGRDEFWWWVTVRRADNTPVSASSEERTFFWRPD